MSKKLFVGNLKFKLKSEDLEDMFSEFGDVEEAYIVSDKNTNRSKGFGFVTFVEDQDAEAVHSGEGVQVRDHGGGERRGDGGESGLEAPGVKADLGMSRAIRGG